MTVNLLPNSSSCLDRSIPEIESEMQTRSGHYPFSIPTQYSLLGDVLTKAFVSQPLLGNVHVSPEERDAIHEAAMCALEHALPRVDMSDYGLDGFYCDVVLLETVLLLRYWALNERETDTDEDERAFWEYLFGQYGLDYDVDFPRSHAYKLFQTVVRKSLYRHQRLFVRSGKKYYTTLLTHALAPVAKFRALFDQVYALYARTLKFQYYERDPVFASFVEAMQKRFAGRCIIEADDVYVKSVQSSSAIRALFQYCPNYMCALVENIVRSIDTLFARGELHEETYLDALILDWFAARGRESHKADRKRRMDLAGERPVHVTNARLTYSYRNGEVVLDTPAIRLIDKPYVIPKALIYRYSGDTTPFCAELPHYGDFYTTTVSMPIPINRLLLTDTKRIELRAVILAGEQVVYDSGMRLYRDAIIFDDSGREITKRPDRQYVTVFVAEGSEVAIDSLDYTEDNYENGHLYRVLVDVQTQITINQTSLLAADERAKSDRFCLSTSPVVGCIYAENQQRYTVFSHDTTLMIKGSDENQAKEYWVVIDGVPAPLLPNYDATCGMYVINLPGGDFCHVIRLVNHASNKVEYTLHYIIVNGFSLHFHGFCYFNTCSREGCLTISDYTGTYRYPYNKTLEHGSMVIPYHQGELEVDVPTLKCYLNDNPLELDANHILWYNEIPMSAVLRLDPPRGYTAQLRIGNKTFVEQRVEIGNEIRSISNVKNVPVCVEVCKGNEQPVEIHLFDIALVPQLRSAPFSIEDGHLYWYIEDTFIGEASTEFKIHLYREGNLVREYSLGCTDDVVDLGNALPDGWYEYVMWVKPPGLFSKLQELLRGQMSIGSPARLRFQNCDIVVTSTSLDGKHTRLKDKSAVITEIRYIGECPLNGEELMYPCYQGKLQDRNGDRFYTYSTTEHCHNWIWYEQVNPVKLWYINDYIIALRSPTDDGLYVDLRSKSITDIKDNPETRAYYINPDYYSYRVVRK
jgi:hypothetical protein